MEPLINTRSASSLTRRICAGAGSTLLAAVSLSFLAGPVRLIASIRPVVSPTIAIWSAALIWQVPFVSWFTPRLGTTPAIGPMTNDNMALTVSTISATAPVAGAPRDTLQPRRGPVARTPTRHVQAERALSRTKSKDPLIWIFYSKCGLERQI